MVVMSESGTRRWLWATGIGGFICGAPSMFFLFFRPFMIPFGFILGICLGGLWAISASFLLEKSLLKKWHFAAMGVFVGMVGTLGWGIISGIFLNWFEGWAPFFVGTAFLILTLSGFLGSIVGQMQITRTAAPSQWNDVVLASVLGFDVLFFVLIPILNLR